MRIIANASILHLGRQYNPGDEIIDADAQMLRLWLEHNSVRLDNDAPEAHVKERKLGSVRKNKAQRGFKEQVEKDLNVFFNTNEFAEIHKLNGKEIPIVINEDLLNELKRSSAGANERSLKRNDGVYEGDLLFYVRKSDYGPRAKIGVTIDFDGTIYRVTDLSEESGVYVITIKAVKA